MARRSSAVQLRSRQTRPDDEAARRRAAEEAKIEANLEAERLRNEERLATAKRLESFNPPVLGPRPKIPQLGYDVGGGPDPERRVVPPVTDPIRNAPPPPPVTARQTRQDLSRPAVPETGAASDMRGSGGPLVQDEQEQPWLNDPIVQPAPKPGAPATASGPKPWENDPIVKPAPAKPTTAGKPYNPDDIDTMLDEIARDIPGGYKAWLEKNNPPKPGMEWVRDPLSQTEKYYQAPIDRPRTQEAVTRQWQEQGKAAEAANDAANEEPWNEQVASALDEVTDFVLAPLTTGRETERQNDPVQAAANLFVKPTAELPALAFRDPVAAYQAVDPTQQAALAYSNAQGAIGDAFDGDWKSAGDKAITGLQQAGNAALGIYGLKSAIGTNKVPARPLTVAEGQRAAASGLPPPPKQAPARVPSVNKSGRTLAAEALPTSVIRPQALKAITRILGNAGIPSDRIALGLARVVESLKGLPDGSPLTRATVTQFLQREFGPEFPQAIENLNTVIRERGLSRGKKDRSASIVRETAQSMRQTQVPFLQERANKNLGGDSKRGTRQEVAENLRLMGEQGYEPILSQPIDPARAARIQGVLQGPGMSELYTPIRQIAAAEGMDIDTMIAQDPLRAAHWMQHKARLLSESQAGNKALGNAYGTLRSRILATIDDLTLPDGTTYAQLRKQFGDEARIDTALDAANSFGALARNPENADNFVAKFEEMTPAQQEAALASVRDWIDTKLRGSGEDMPARMGELQSVGVLDTLDRLGPQGKAMADDIRAIRSESQFLRATTNDGQSATVPNATAMQEAPGLYSSGIANSIPTNMMGDAAMMASGVSSVPILTAMRHGPRFMQRMFMPKRQTLEDMTRVLMARPANKTPISQMVEGAKPKVATPPPPSAGAKPGKAAPAPAKPAVDPNDPFGDRAWQAQKKNSPLPANDSVSRYSGEADSFGSERSSSLYALESRGYDDLGYTVAPPGGQSPAELAGSALREADSPKQALTWLRNEMKLTPKEQRDGIRKAIEILERGPAPKPKPPVGTGPKAPPVVAKTPTPPFKPVEGAEVIDTTSWTPAEFNAARKQLNEMMQDRRTMSGQQLADLDSEITSLRNALEMDGPPAQFADVPMASRFNQPVDIPWKKGSPESLAVEKAIADKAWTVRSVPIEKVIPTQDSVFFDYAKSASRYAGDEKFPIVVKQGGKYYVADGHHRMMAQAGEGPIRARVIDLDAGASKLPPPPPPKKN